MRNIKGILTAACFAFMTTFAVAQDAQSILNDLSAKAQKYNTVFAKYTSQLKADGVDQTQSGQVYVEGEKYNLDLGNYIIITDGENLWSFDKGANECYIDYLEDVGDETMSPSKMFTIWEDNFKNELKGTLDVDGKPHYHINLYPNNQAEQTYHTIQLYVDKAKMEVTKFVVKGRDGTDVVYSVKEFKPNSTIPGGTFKFDKSKHPGVQMIDNRL